MFLLDIILAWGRYRRIIQIAYFSRQETHEYGVSESVYNGLKGYTKNYAWKYEAECRLCVEINERVFTSLPDHEAINTVIIKLPDGVVGKVVRAPNYQGEIPESVESYKSLLDEKIDWNLCDKCIYREKKQ